MRAVGQVGLAVAMLAVVCCAQDQANADAEFLRRASTEVQRYTDTFHDLTAEETATITAAEPYNRRVPPRTIVSSLIIYRSQADPKRWTEYRDVESVDGKVVKDHSKRAVKLLEKATDAKSAFEELERIRKEGNRYHEHIQTSNLTLMQGLPFRNCISAYRFHRRPDEQVRQVPTRVYEYEQMNACETFQYQLGLPRAYETGPRTHRGTIWLDARTAQLVREHREVDVQNAQAPGIKLCMAEMTFEYQPSPFGILVPSTISITAFRLVTAGTRKEPVTVPIISLTQAYGPFARFEVSVEQKVNEPK